MMLSSNALKKRAGGKSTEKVSSSTGSTHPEVRNWETGTMNRPQGYTEGEAPASQQRSASTGGSKVTWERALLVVSALLAAAVIVIWRLSFDNMQTKKSFQTLRDEHDAMKRNVTERHCEVKCPQPPAEKIGWEKLGRKCYYFSTDKLSWEKSREECKRQKGGDLVVIDSLQEQAFLMVKLMEKMNETEDKFWIGLTDSKIENKWSWVDGSSLNMSLSFWTSGEPDDWKGENPAGEDCARMGERGGAADLKCWFDTSCEKPHRRICEKPAEPRHLKCV